MASNYHITQESVKDCWEPSNSRLFFEYTYCLAIETRADSAVRLINGVIRKHLLSSEFRETAEVRFQVDASHLVKGSGVETLNGAYCPAEFR